jgi:Hydrazine synthase alpha subunit middle domain
VSIPDPQTLKLDPAAFGITNYMRQILGYAPIQPDGSVVIQVPAYVAFQMSILDATGKRLGSSPIHDAWLQLIPGETVHCNGCHTPAAQQNPAAGMTAVSHGRFGAFNSAYAGGTASIGFPGSLASYTSSITATSAPLIPTTTGMTMAETLSAASCQVDSPHCLQNMPLQDPIYTDLWTNPAAATPGTPITNLTYQSIGQEFASAPTLAWVSPGSAGCQPWSSLCRIIINYTEHIQPLWLLPRTYVGGVAAGQSGACTMCHGPTSAGGIAQVPAGVTQLDLTSTASNEEPLQPVSYRRLLFAHDEQTIMMGVLTDVLVNGPIDPTTGLPTQVPVSIGPPMNAGSALGSTRFFNEFAASGTHAGYLSPAELRLLSDWLDIGAQYFNNPFDPTAPLD